MKRLFALSLTLLLVFGLASPALAAPPPPDKLNCQKIQDGTIKYSAGHYLAGQPLPIGFDAYGYNYQAHLFSGSYANAYLGGLGFPAYTGDDATYLAANPNAASTWVWPYRNDQLLMKWDEDWLANVDCDNDGKLDRHMGTPAYIGSEAWITNHMWGNYVDAGQSCTWDWFTKIVAAPSNATQSNGVWYTAEGVEIGSAIWGEFATIQSVYNDPCSGFTGLEYLSSDHAGFGGW